MNEDFHKKVMAALQERLRVIAGNEEQLVEAWVAQHGFKPDECEIVRQDMQNGTVRMWVAKRGEFQELQRFRAREPLVAELIERIARDEDETEIYLAMDRLRDRTLSMRIAGASADASIADDLTGAAQKGSSNH